MPALAQQKVILRKHGNYSWLTEKGNFVILNNGIEFAATYLIMLLSLLVYGWRPLGESGLLDCQAL